MGKIGYGYGSEYHLLRFMGRHRRLLDQRVLASTGGDSVEWLDFCFHLAKPWLDAEIKGLDFMPQGHAALEAWKDWWPKGSGIHNWDAVGRTQRGGSVEWLLVEAKAHA